MISRKTAINQLRIGLLALALVTLVWIVLGEQHKRRVEKDLQAFRTNPVVVDVLFTEWIEHPDGWSALVHGDKVRSCTFVSVLVSNVRTGQDGLGIEFVDDTSPGSTRPRGSQNFGRWRFRGDIRSGDALLIELKHICERSGEAVRVHTELGRVTVGDT